MSKITVEEYRNRVKPVKYRNKKTVVNGKKFDSKFEADMYLELLALQNHKEISGLKCQVPYQIHPTFVDGQGKRHRAIKYVVDFLYTENGKTIAVDAKGFKTAIFKLKEKMFRFCYPEIELRVICKK